MSITGEDTRIVFVGDGNDNSPYAIDFHLRDEDSVEVIYTTDADGTEVVKVRGVDYSIAIANDFASATLTLITTAPDGPAVEKMLIRRNEPATRLSNYKLGDGQPAAVSNNDFDVRAMSEQTLQEQLDRALVVAKGHPDANLPLTPINMIGSAGLFVVVNSGETDFELLAGSNLTGSGTLNTIPLWTPDGDTLGDSALTQSGSGIVVSRQELVVRETAIGSSVSLVAINLDATDLGSDALMQVAVADTTSGDPYVSWLVAGAQEYVLGIDNSDSDKLVGSVGNALGTANWLEVTTAGAVNIPGSLQIVGTLSSLSSDGGITGTEAGDNVSWLISNAHDSDVGSGARLTLLTQEATGGDPHILFAIGGPVQSYVLGIDNSDSDKFVGSVGAVLGTANWLEVTTAGAVLFPGVLSAGSSPTVLTTAAGLLRHQAIDPNIAGSGITYTSGVLSVTSGLTGSGTENTIPLWGAGGVVLGDSIISQSSTVVTVAGTFVVAGSTMDIADNNVGNRVLLHVQNTDNTDTGSHSIIQVSSTSSNGGDPYIQWQVAGNQSYVMGIDNSDSDKLVGSVGATLGTANWLEVTTARGITLDAASGQTVALAVNATEELQVSGTAVTIPSNGLIVTMGDVSIGAGVTPDARLEVGTGTQWSSSNFGANIVVSGGRNNAIGFLDSAGNNPWAIGVRTSGNLEFNTMPALGDTGSSPVLRVVFDDSGQLGIGNAPTLPFDVNAKAGITSIGGYAIKLTNKTGGVTAKGQLVIASTSTANAFETAGVSDDRVIGIVLELGAGVDSEAWIVVAGFALVLMDAGGASLGDRIISSTTAGSGLVANGPASAQHFQEIGHAVGAGGSGALVKCAIHLN